MSDEFDINQLREALAARIPAPPDAVAPRGLDRTTILALNASVLIEVTVEDSQPMLESPDGEPMTVPPPIVGDLMMGGPVIPRHALDDAGLTVADVPNLTVVDVPRRPR